MCGRASAGHRPPLSLRSCQLFLPVFVVWPDISDPDDKEHIIRNIIIISQ